MEQIAGNSDRLSYGHMVSQPTALPSVSLREVSYYVGDGRGAVIADPERVMRGTRDEALFHVR